MLASVNPVRTMQRSWQVQAIFLRYGFDILISHEQLQEVRQFLINRLGYRPHEFSHLSVPARVRLMLQELGPTFVKLGQVVSSQSQSLPPAWLAELEQLQSNVPPFAYEEVRAVINANLGKPPEEIFAWFDEQPLAAASLGQVHRATLPSGEAVAVKVQRPGIRPDISDDLAILLDTARWLERTTTWARNFDVVGVVQKFADGLQEELDYRIEAQYADRLRAAMSTVEGVRAPTIYWDYVTAEVLTMELIQGVKITNVAALDAAAVDRPMLADRFIQSMIQQVLLDGFFHADPHPGNVLVVPASGEIVFIDAGMMDFLAEDQRATLGRLIVAMHERDAAEVTHCAVLLGMAYKEVNEPALRRALSRLLSRYLAADLARISFADLVSKILATLFAHGLRLSSELTLAVKALVQMEQIARTLNPDLSMQQIVRTAFNELLEQQLTVDALIAGLQRTAREVARLAPDMRDAVEVLTRQVKSGKLTIRVDNTNLAAQSQSLERIANRLTLGASLTGVAVGSAILVHASALKDDALLRKLGASGFSFALLANGVMIGAVLRDVWRQRGRK